MQIHWPLVISTACQRAGLGLYACTWLTMVIFGPQVPVSLAALIALAFLAVGGCASVFHLQRPQRFFNAFSNPKSHLTQEGLITPFLGIALLLTGLGIGGAAMQAVAAVLALAFLVCTGLAYQMKSRPAWNTAFVISLFLLTSLAAGFVGTATLLFACTQDGATSIAICALIVLLACAAAQFGYIARMKKVGYGVAYDALKEPYKPTTLCWASTLGLAFVLMVVALLVPALALVLAFCAWTAIIVSIGAWTVLFFRGAHKVRMFPMYPVDLNLDM